MNLDVEGRPTIENATAAQVGAALSDLRSHRPPSFASLTDANGNYVQVAGGGMSCVLERRDRSDGRHYRAFKEQESKIFPDGTR